MTHRFFPLIHRILSFSFIVSISLAATLSAQVIIREKITLSPVRKGPPLVRTPQSGNCVDNCVNGSHYPGFSGLIMNKKGSLIISYVEAQRLGNGEDQYIPITANLRAHRFRQDTTVVADSVGWYFPFDGITSCVRSDAGCNPQSIVQVNYAQTALIATYPLLPVQQGDSVQFLYLTGHFPSYSPVDTFPINSYDYDTDRKSVV